MKNDREIAADIAAELLWDPRCGGQRPGCLGAGRDCDGPWAGCDSLAERRGLGALFIASRAYGGSSSSWKSRSRPITGKRTRRCATRRSSTLRWRFVRAAGNGQGRSRGWMAHADRRSRFRLSARQCRTMHPAAGWHLRPGQQDNAEGARGDAGDIGLAISAALARHARRDACRIGVEVEGGVVTLTGKVGSLSERDAVVGTARSTKGVSRIADRLVVTAGD